MKKEAKTLLWTAHDGMFQVTVVAPGDTIITYEMTPEAFYRQFGRQGELVASKMSGVGRSPFIAVSDKPG